MQNELEFEEGAENGEHWKHLKKISLRKLSLKVCLIVYTEERERERERERIMKKVIYTFFRAIRTCQNFITEFVKVVLFDSIRI